MSELVYQFQIAQDVHIQSGILMTKILISITLKSIFVIKIITPKYKNRFSSGAGSTYHYTDVYREVAFI